MVTTLDPTRITYEDANARQAYAEKNAVFCRKINEGYSFTVVFTQPLWDDSGRITVGTNYGSEGDLYYALVVMSDKAVLPYPLFEEAMGVFFKHAELLQVDELTEQTAVLATQAEFCAWLEEHFTHETEMPHSHFMGLAQAWSGALDDRKAAITFAAELAQPAGWWGENKSPHRDRMVSRLEYEIRVLLESGYPRKPLRGIVGGMYYKLARLDPLHWLRECTPVVSASQGTDPDPDKLVTIHFLNGYGYNRDAYDPAYFCIYTSHQHGEGKYWSTWSLNPGDASLKEYDCPLILDLIVTIDSVTSLPGYFLGDIVKALS